MSQTAQVYAFDPVTADRNSPTRIPTAERVRAWSRDEMNLAEFPLTVLSTRNDPSLKTLEFKDAVIGKNGEKVERSWIITGADKFGLPTASDDEVLLGLLRLTSESEFRNRKVTFTRYELLRTLKWTTEGRSYSRLQKALDRLSGVRIKTTNGFFDNTTKSHSTRNFGIIDAYEINDGRGPSYADKPSFFTWSEVIFQSFQAGFIKKLDLDFLLGLQSAVAKRLYRFLDKHFWYRSKVQYNLFTLAHEKIGISRNYAYASQLKQQMAPAIEELIAQKFLLGCEYVGKGSDTQIILYAAVGNRKEAKARELAAAPTALTPEQPTLSGDAGMVQALVQRGINERQAEALVQQIPETMKAKARRIVQYFDQLVSQRSAKISKSPVGFLYRAIQRVESFVLPGDMLEAKPAVKVSPKAPPKNSQSAADIIQAQYLVERRKLIDQLREEAEPELLSRIEREVTQALKKLNGLISEARFKDAVAHGVEERLARLFAVPDFAEWKKGCAAS